MIGFKKIAALIVGASLSVGVGVGISSIDATSEVRAANSATATYTVSSKTSVSVDGTTPNGSTASYSQTYGTTSQATKGNSFTLTLSGYDGCTINSLSISVHSNKKAGAGYLSLKVGSTTIASIGSSSNGISFNNSEWYGSYSDAYVSKELSISQTEVGDSEKIVLTIGATTNSLFFESATITYTEPEESTEPSIDSVVVDPSSTATLGLNSTMSATATVYDSNNTGDGALSTDVTWTASPSGMITFSDTQTATGVSTTITSGSTEGEVVVTATSVGNTNKKASFTLNIIDALSSLTIGGSMTKTTYYTNEEWDVSGLTVTATYASGKTVDVTSETVWSFDKDSPAAAGTGADVSLEVTAKYGGKTKAKTIRNLVVEEAPVQNTFGINGNYYITTTRDDVKYYMQANGTSAPLAVTDQSQATEFEFVLVDDDTFTIKSGEDFLYCTNNNNGLRVGSESDKWLITAGTRESGSYDIKSVNRDRYISLYNSEDFRSYTTPDANNRLENTDLEQSSTIESITMTGDLNSTKYAVGSSWSHDGLTVTATLSNGNTSDVTNNVTWSYSPETPAADTTSVTVTARYRGFTTSKQFDITIVSGLRAAYEAAHALENGKTSSGYYTFSGIVTGVNGRSYYLGDGDYAIQVYNDSVTTSAVEVGQQRKVTAKVCKYNNLEETATGTITYSAIDSSETVATPKTLKIESYSQLVDSVKNMNCDALNLIFQSGSAGTSSATGHDGGTYYDYRTVFKCGTSDDTMQINLSRYMTSTEAGLAAYNKIYAVLSALTQGEEVTVKNGKTYVYGNTYEIESSDNTVVEKSCLKIAATAMLNAVGCTADGSVAPTFNGSLEIATVVDDTYTTNTQTITIDSWAALKSCYNALTTSDKEFFKGATADESGTELQQFLARYDYIVSKYAYEDFLNRGSSSGTRNNTGFEYNNEEIVVIASAVAMITALAAAVVVIKKRKEA